MHTSTTHMRTHAHTRTHTHNFTKKADSSSPSSYQLAINWLLCWWNYIPNSLLHTEILSGMNLFRFYAHCHKRYEFICVTKLLCPKYITFLLSTTSSAIIPEPWKKKVWCRCCINFEHLCILILRTLANCRSCVVSFY